MIQVWTMPGLHGIRADDPLGQLSQVLDEAGYTSVVATNCDQAYHRYLKLGEQLSVRARLLDVTGPKRTALGARPRRPGAAPGAWRPGRGRAGRCP